MTFEDWWDEKGQYLLNRQDCARNAWNAAGAGIKPLPVNHNGKFEVIIAGCGESLFAEGDA